MPELFDARFYYDPEKLPFSYHHWELINICNEMLSWTRRGYKFTKIEITAATAIP